MTELEQFKAVQRKMAAVVSAALEVFSDGTKITLQEFIDLVMQQTALLIANNNVGLDGLTAIMIFQAIASLGITQELIDTITDDEIKEFYYMNMFEVLAHLAEFWET